MCSLLSSMLPCSAVAVRNPYKKVKVRGGVRYYDGMEKTYELTLNLLESYVSVIF
jgi:hypothetical protein